MIRVISKFLCGLVMKFSIDKYQKALRAHKNISRYLYAIEVTHDTEHYTVYLFPTTQFLLHKPHVQPSQISFTDREPCFTH